MLITAEFLVGLAFSGVNHRRTIMTRTEFKAAVAAYGVRNAAWLAAQLGVSLTLALLWLRTR